MPSPVALTAFGRFVSSIPTATNPVVMRVFLIILLPLLAACSGTRPSAPILLASELPENQLQSLRADPSVHSWEPDEVIVAVCEPAAGETLVLTTYRILTYREGATDARFIALRGHETISYERDRMTVTGRTAIGISFASITPGRCDRDTFAALTADVIQLRNEGGTAAEFLAHHERLQVRNRTRAEAAQRERDRRIAEMGAPIIPGLTWADIPDLTARLRAVYEHFDVTPSDLAPLLRQYPDGAPGAFCRYESIARLCTTTINVSYGGSCRAAALFYVITYYGAHGAEGMVRAECPDYNVNVRLSPGAVEVQQFRAGTTQVVYAHHGPIELLDFVPNTE